MSQTIKSRSNSESGYTMQTLIIIAILVLAATTAAALLYAILRDSTGRIAGGSETFDGLPSGPQNLQVETVLSGANVDLTISWEAPSYLGEFPPTGYELSVTENNSPKLEHNNSDWNCGGTNGVGVLATTNPAFTYANSCEGTVTMVDNDADYELLFTINLGSADASYSPGGLTFYRELDLSTMPAPPSQVNAVSLSNALAVSWEAESNIAYRLYIDIDGDDIHDPTDYYQCFNSKSEEVTREIPNIAGRDGYQSTATLQRGQQYTVRLSAASTALTLDATRCSDDDNFGTAVSFTGSFGIPSAPVITLETDLTRTAGTETLPSLKATLASCDANSSTTFFWQVAGQPQTQMSHTIQGCGTAGCTVNCALTVYEDFEVDTEYEVWAVAENSVGTSSPSERQGWLPTGASVSSSPGPPRNINTFTEADGILVSWDTPGFVPDAGIRGYILRSQEKPSGAACPATPSDELEISADTVQYKFPTQEQYKIYCFQLSAFSIDSSQTELESKKEDFETVYVYVNPLSIGTDEFLLNWHPDPRAEYYTLNWAPLTSDSPCNTADNLLTAPSRQPPNFLSATIPYNGEETLTYTIPAIRNTYYLLRSTATLNNGANVSWQRYVCTNLYNAPSVAAPAWTGMTTPGNRIFIQWTKPDESATGFDKRYAPYSYALKVEHTPTVGTKTTEYFCIPFGDSRLVESVVSTVTKIDLRVAQTSAAGVYQSWLTVAPSAECSINSEAMSIIDSTPDTTPPPVDFGTRTIM